MTTALITGHRGFIGRHIDAECQRLGWEVSGCDIVDGDDCRDLFASSAVCYDIVFHCAAIVGGRAVIDGDPLAVAQNLAIDSDMFRWAARTNPGRVVYFSSSAAYPVRLQLSGLRCSLHEEFIYHGTIANPRQLTPPYAYMPDQTYGWAKLTGEVLAQHARNSGLLVDVYRPFSGYGTDQDLTYPFPAFIERARRRADPFEVWGDGTQVRDWIHVDDIIEAVFAGLSECGSVGPLNLCTGRPVSFLELANMVMRAAGYTGTIETFPDRPTGVHTRVGSPRALRKLHIPQVSLEEGIDRALQAAR